MDNNVTRLTSIMDKVKEDQLNVASEFERGM